MDIGFTLTTWIITRAFIWVPGLIAAITIIRRREERWRFRGVSIWLAISLFLDMAFWLLAFIMSNPGQGAEP